LYIQESSRAKVCPEQEPLGSAVGRVWAALLIGQRGAATACLAPLYLERLAEDREEAAHAEALPNGGVL
jgi:hypothetical protein